MINLVLIGDLQFYLFHWISFYKSLTVKESKKWDFSGLSADKAGVAPQLLVGDHAKRVQREEVVPMITND